MYILYMSGGGLNGGFGAMAIYDASFGNRGILMTDRIRRVEPKCLSRKVNILCVVVLSASGTGLMEETALLVDMDNLHNIMWQGVLRSDVIGPVAKECTAQQDAARLFFLDMNEDGWSDLLLIRSRSYVPNQPYQIAGPVEFSHEVFLFDDSGRSFKAEKKAGILSWP